MADVQEAQQSIASDSLTLVSTSVDGTVMEKTAPPLWSDEVAELMRAHLSQWIALQDGQIVAAADPLDAVLDAAGAVGVVDLVVCQVPSHPDRVAAYAAQPDRARGCV